MIKYSQQIGRDGDLKPVPIAEKTAKNLNGVASHPIIFRVLLWQIKLVLKTRIKDEAILYSQYYYSYYVMNDYLHRE